MNPDSIPAFPFIDSASPLEHPGMTLRDYFAAKALPIAWAAYHEGYTLELEPERITGHLARHAYSLADAMLKARGTP
jgi:hypothetical protein